MNAKLNKLMYQLLTDINENTSLSTIYLDNIYDDYKRNLMNDKDLFFAMGGYLNALRDFDVLPRHSIDNYISQLYDLTH